MDEIQARQFLEDLETDFIPELDDVPHDTKSTPYYCYLKTTGITFAWFYNSELAIYIANELLRNYQVYTDIQLILSKEYKGYDLDNLVHHYPWQRLKIRGYTFYLSRSKLKVSTWDIITSTITNCIRKFDEYEKSNNRN